LEAKTQSGQTIGFHGITFFRTKYESKSNNEKSCKGLVNTGIKTG